MKINARLLLLTFTIVVLVTVSSSIVYYSLTNKLIAAQQNQNILNSTNDFIFNFQLAVEEIEDNYKQIIQSNKKLSLVNLQNEYIDFVFTLINDSQINFDNYAASSNLNIRSRHLSLIQFMQDNPNIIFKYDVRDDNTYYYGKIITENFLNDISEKIRADIALIINHAPVELTKSNSNTLYLTSILDAIDNLKFKNQFDIYYNAYQRWDFYATYYIPTTLLTKDIKIGFMIFNPLEDVVEFRYNAGIIAVLITSSGIALALILVLLFTSKLRSQISNLSYASEVIGKGNLDHRVPVDSKNELGKLGQAFNKMLDALNDQKQAEKEYTEFITLLNQKPSLHEISEAAIQKIIKATGISFGVLYLVEEKDSLRKIASFGVSNGVSETNNNFDYYRNAIEQKDIIEFKFKKNLPVVKTGLTEIRIKYTIIVPIIYGNNVVAVAELASEETPKKDVREYLLNIREQLAIGIINGSSFEKLEILVDDLKKLNVEYENQNKELRELHHKLKAKADELNLERIKALESTKLKSQFLTNITHELKTPLNSIIGLSDLINKDETLSLPHKNRLNVIIRNGRKLLNLINNILEYSKAEAGKTIIKNETFLLNNFIEEINSFILPIANEKGLNYICNAPEETSVVLYVDKAKLEQVIINLLNNAIKFTDEGFIKLHVDIESENDLVITVEDTGIGVDEKDKEIIFEEFRQADGTISRQYDGTGLGLSICKKFTELLGGEFHLESEIGKGSKFTIRLFDVILKKGSFENISEVLSQQNKRVMILEENPKNKKLISDYLTLNDYHVINYENGTDIAEEIKTQNVSRVIINQDFNNSSGWKYLVDIKNNNILKNITPIIISTFNENNYGYGLAVFDYITTNNCGQQCVNILNELSIELGRKSLRIISLVSDTIVNNFLKSNFNAEIIKNSSYYKNISLSKKSDQPDVIFIDVSKKSVSIVDQFKHDRNTRSIHFIGLISNNFEDEQKSLSNELLKVTLARKHHVIDILKILRDRLQISENELTRAKLILDETPSEIDIKKQTKSINEIRILIVDDDRDTLFTVGEIVKSSGYHPLFAKNGVECILTLKHEIPDLILLDIMMPKMDGFETLKEIRKHKEYDGIPVVALTAYAMLDDKDIINKSGFEDIITKPIDTITMTNKLNYIFNK